MSGGARQQESVAFAWGYLHGLADASDRTLAEFSAADLPGEVYAAEADPCAAEIMRKLRASVLDGRAKLAAAMSTLSAKDKVALRAMVGLLRQVNLLAAAALMDQSEEQGR